MINHHPNGRFQLHERPINIPGLDIINKSPDGPVFDLSVDTDNLPWGTAYIRAEHVMDMAKCLGMKTLEDYADLVEENNKLRAQVANLPLVVRDFKDGLDSLLSDFDSNLSESPSVPVLPVAEKPEVPAKPDGESEPSNGQSLSPAIDKRSDSVSGDTGNVFGFLNNLPDGT